MNSFMTGGDIAEQFLASFNTDMKGGDMANLFLGSFSQKNNSPNKKNQTNNRTNNRTNNKTNNRTNNRKNQPNSGNTITHNTTINTVTNNNSVQVTGANMPNVADLSTFLSNLKLEIDNANAQMNSNKNKHNANRAVAMIDPIDHAIKTNNSFLDEIKEMNKSYEANNSKEVSKNLKKQNNSINKLLAELNSNSNKKNNSNKNYNKNTHQNANHAPELDDETAALYNKILATGSSRDEEVTDHVTEEQVNKVLDEITDPKNTLTEKQVDAAIDTIVKSTNAMNYQANNIHGEAMKLLETIHGRKVDIEAAEGNKAGVKKCNEVLHTMYELLHLLNGALSSDPNKQVEAMNAIADMLESNPVFKMEFMDHVNKVANREDKRYSDTTVEKANYVKESLNDDGMQNQLAKLNALINKNNSNSNNKKNNSGSNNKKNNSGSNNKKNNSGSNNKKNNSNKNNSNKNNSGSNKNNGNGNNKKNQSLANKNQSSVNKEVQNTIAQMNSLF